MLQQLFQFLSTDVQILKYTWARLTQFLRTNTNVSDPFWTHKLLSLVYYTHC